jgi:hypothetical protein
MKELLRISFLCSPFPTNFDYNCGGRLDRRADYESGVWEGEFTGKSFLGLVAIPVNIYFSTALPSPARGLIIHCVRLFLKMDF